MVAFVLKRQHCAGITQIRLLSSVRQRAPHVWMDNRFRQTTIDCPQTQISLLRRIDRFPNQRQRGLDSLPISQIPSLCNLRSQELKTAQRGPMPLSDYRVTECDEFATGQYRTQVKEDTDGRVHRQLKPIVAFCNIVASHAHPLARHLATRIESDQVQMAIDQSSRQWQAEQPRRRCPSGSDSRNDHRHRPEFEILLHPRIVCPTRSRMLNKPQLITMNAVDNGAVSGVMK